MTSSLRAFLRERTLSSSNPRRQSFTPGHLAFFCSASALSTPQLRLPCCKPSATSPPRRRRVCSLTRNTSANMPRFFQVNNVGEPRPRLTALPQWKVSWTSWLSVSSRHGRRSSRLRAKPVCGRPDSGGGANSQAYPSGIYCYRSSTRYLSMPPSWGWLCLLGCEEQTLTSG